VPEDLELDGLDEECSHFVVYCEERVIATARLRSVSVSKRKLERVAVLRAFRGKGVGRALVGYLLSALDQNVECVVVHAQISARSFWQKLGFHGEGELFQEAGIDHVEMSFSVERD